MLQNEKVSLEKLAEEVRLISHNVRSSLSILKVGASLAQQESEELIEIAPAMKIKVDEIDAYCQRLTEISGLLNLR